LIIGGGFAGIGAARGTQGRNREDRLVFSEFAILSPLLGSAAHESVN
jgi:thioredoxin reductase